MPTTRAHQASLTAAAWRLHPGLRAGWRALFVPLPHPVPTGTCGHGLALAQAAALDHPGLLALLPAALQAAVPRRRQAFLAGRWCAELALADAAGQALLVGQGEQRQPLWPAGWLGSITHDDDAAFACALAQQPAGLRGLGLDTQPLLDAQAVQDVRSACFTDLERRSLPATAEATTLVFAAKEAAYKAMYTTVARYVDFTEAQLLPWQASPDERLQVLPVPDTPLAAELDALDVSYLWEPGGRRVHAVAMLGARSGDRTRMPSFEGGGF